MKNLIISLESTCDLTPELLKNYELAQIDMSFFVDGNEYNTENDNVVSSGLYEKMKTGKKTSTSQINTETYTEFFEKLLTENKPILHLAFSSGLSGTFKQDSRKQNLCCRQPLRLWGARAFGNFD